MTVAALAFNDAKSMSVAAVSDSDASDWEGFLAARRARAFARFAWGHILQESYGAKSFRFAARDSSGVVRGVLSAYSVRDARGRLRFFGVRNGMVADNDLTATRLIEAASARGRALGAASLLLGSGGTPLALEGRVDRKSLALALGADEDETWDKLRRETRVGVKRSVKRGARVEWGYRNLPAFHDVFARNMLDKGVPVHSLRFLETLREHLGEAVDLVVVLNGDEVVAGMVVLWSADTLDLYLGAWLREHAALVPYQRMYWEAIQEAQRRGVRVVDMGESAEGSGTYKFKRNFGCEAEDVYYYAWPPQSPASPRADAAAPRPPLRTLMDSAIHRLPFAWRRGLATWRQAHGRLV